MDSLSAFHPAIRSWFERRFPLGPTEAQAQGWPTIAQGRDTLIAAPTGTGKTLTAFLVCIDRLYKESETITRIMAISLHPYITGAAHRIRYLEELYRYILERTDVAMWTGAEIADWYRGEITKAAGS